ncbi:MAG: hypothetical protein E7639_06110 [Ruminococcaceae bacterium]|nr:hypothetical protein [Oscillospiraceae bacterium]
MRVDKLFGDLDLTRRKGALHTYDLKIKDIVTTPDRASTDTVYIALKTVFGDGHSGAMAAYSRGCRVFVGSRVMDLPPDAAEYYTPSPEQAAAVLAAKCYGKPVRDVTVIGITGTHGKTSVVDTFAALLRRAGKRVATLSTDGITCGEGFVASGNRAPDVTDVWRFLRLAHRERAEFAVVEFSSYMLAQKAHFSIPFTAVLLTDYAPYHIGTVHADEAAYRAAKQALLDSTAALTLLPCDCAELTARGRVVRYGVGGEIALREVRRQGHDGVTLTVDLLGEEIELFYPVVGDFAYKNAIAAAALALAVGASPTEIAQAMPYAAPKGRLECLFAEDGKRIYLDAAYEGDALATALRALRSVTDARLSVLLGAVGGRAAERRVPLGEAAFTYADFVWLTADDADAESPQKIAEEIVGDYYNSAAYRVCPSRAAAIEAAVADMQAGDTLLILGKPREDTQLVCGKKQFFSDRLQVRQALKRT